jgi:hypothetical protein
MQLLKWESEIVRSIREENGFILAESGHWVRDPHATPREAVRISPSLFSFLESCDSAAVNLLEKSGDTGALLNRQSLQEVVNLVRYFRSKEYADAIPEPFSEQATSAQLVEALQNTCSNEGGIDDVLSNRLYIEQISKFRCARETEVSEAVIEAVSQILEHIESSIGKIRSSLDVEDVSPNINNT